jgi:hypothetical protein
MSLFLRGLAGEICFGSSYGGSMNLAPVCAEEQNHLFMQQTAV